MTQELYDKLPLHHKRLFDKALSWYDHQVDGGEPATHNQLSLIQYIKDQPIPDKWNDLDEDDDFFYEWIYDNDQELSQILGF